MILILSFQIWPLYEDRHEQELVYTQTATAATAAAIQTE
jgi:hypothetical protein